jgi:ribosomal protein S12 methylthiotransferase accessory factor YcaO
MRRSRLCLLRNPQNSSQDAQINDALASAQKIGVQIRLFRANTGREFGNVFASLTNRAQEGSSSLTMSFFSARVLNLAP